MKKINVFKCFKLIVFIFVLLIGLNHNAIIQSNVLLENTPISSMKTFSEHQMDISNNLIENVTLNLVSYSDELFQGSGTEIDPYLISSTNDLVLFAQLINGINSNVDYTNKYYRMTNDIDISYIENWNSIGDDSSNGFNGTFDGNEYTIYGLKMETFVEELEAVESSYYGLFGYVTGYIKNLKLEDVHISLIINEPGYETVANIGGFVGESRAVLSNLHFNGTIQIVNKSYRNVKVLAGGIVGKQSGIMNDCQSLGELKINSEESTLLGQALGGIVGENNGIIDGAKNFSNIYALGSNLDIGGIAGVSFNNISNVFNFGNINGKNLKANGRVGGVIGCQYVEPVDVTVSYAVNTGKITSNYSAGGIVGYVYGTLGGRKIELSELANTGEVEGYEFSGGIVGMMNNGTTLKKAYNRGNISNGSTTGGVIGYAYYPTLISEVYNTGRIFSRTGSGGILGAIRGGKLINAYNYGDLMVGFENESGYIGGIACYASEVEYTNGLFYLDNVDKAIGSDSQPQPNFQAQKLTNTEMCNQLSFSSFDFENIWGMPESVNHPPVLKSLYIPLDGFEPIEDYMLTGQERKAFIPIPLHASITQGYYFSTDENVFQVDRNGVVKATKPGIANVIGTTIDGELSVFLEIEVKQGVENILLPENISVSVGETQEINYDIQPDTSFIKDVTWESRNNSIATVNDFGVVTGVSPGETEIIVTTKDGTGIAVNMTVKVVQPIRGIDILHAEENIYVGEKRVINYQLSPTNATNQNVIWTSSDEKLAYVNQNNEIIAVQAGDVEITAQTEDGAYEDTLIVHIYNQIERISITNKVSGVAIGKSIQLGLEVYPQNTMPQNFIWSISDTEIAVIGEYGKITGVKAGEVVVIVRSLDGKFMDYHLLNVGSSVNHIEVLGLEEVVQDQETVYQALVDPIEAVNSTIAWSVKPLTGNGAITSDGKFHAQDVGEVIIIASATDGSEVYSELLVNVIPIVIELESIEVTKQPAKTSYYVGEALDLTGLEVTGTYNNGSTKLEEVTLDNISGYGSSEPKIGQMVTVTLDGKTATFTVNIQAIELESIAVTKQLTKTIYYVGESLDLTGLEVTGTYNNGSTKVEVVTLDNLFGFDSSQPAEQQAVTVTIEGKSDTFTVQIIEPISIRYRTHVQKYGWQEFVADGTMSGTSGLALRLEGIEILVDSNLDLGVQYSTHIQNIGWQDYVVDGAMSGTSGQALRLEAIKIELTGADKDRFDVYYRVHAEKFGWMDWAKNGNAAGTAGFAYRLEAIEIRIVEKGTDPGLPTATSYRSKNPVQNIRYRTHVQNIGWQDYVYDGAMSGTSGLALRLEGIEIEKIGDHLPTGSIEYTTHVQKIGWQDYVSDGAMSGTSGLSLRLEAIRIRLTGTIEMEYDIYYRVHAQKFGWMGWAKNGEDAGTAGFGYRLEGIEILLVPKGGLAPGSTANAFVQK